MRSLLAGLDPVDIRTDPFPHIVADMPMAPALYAELSASFPPFQRIAWDGPADRVPNNRRFTLPAQSIIDAPDLPDCWKAFAAAHSAPALLDAVLALFDGHWPPALLAALGEPDERHSIGRLVLSSDHQPRIRQDARIEINTPARDRPSSPRGPHLDTPNRLFSCLFYMRHPDDDSVGGDLRLFRWRDGARGRAEDFEQPADAVEAVAIIPYAANRLVIFPQGPDALHGVSPRHPTRHTRRYVFITAELDHDWLTLPAATGN